MAIEATKASVHLRVVHETWLPGRVLFGTIVAVPNRWHVVLNTAIGRITAAQASLIWEQDWKAKNKK